MWEVCKQYKGCQFELFVFVFLVYLHISIQIENVNIVIVLGDRLVHRAVYILISSCWMFYYNSRNFYVFKIHDHQKNTMFNS